MTDIQDLIADYIALQDEAARVTGLLGHVAYEITKAMQADGSSMLLHPTHKVSLKPSSPTWDYARLSTLREIIPNGDLEESGAYTPRHEETKWVPESWNMTKVNVFKALGDDVTAIIDGARIPGAPQLVIKAKEDN